MSGMDKKSNDLFFTCSLIDYIGRKTKNHRADVVNQLGKERIAKIYELADVYHCDSIDRVSDDFIAEAEIQTGSFFNVEKARYTIPTHWEMGQIYRRLTQGIAKYENIGIIDALFKAYNSFVSEKIDDYNSIFYCENPQNILNAYIYGEIE